MIDLGAFQLHTSAVMPRTMPNVQLSPNCDPQGLWCTPEFRARVNEWLRVKLGEAPYIFSIGGGVLVAHPDNAAYLKEMMRRMPR